MSEEIKSIYKVNGLEFDTQEEAETYVEDLKKQKEETEQLEKDKKSDLNKILNYEKKLAKLYEDFEKKYGFLEDRSNNIKELLSNILKGE